MEKLPGIRNQKNISVNIRVSEGINTSIYINGFLCSQISRLKFQEKTNEIKIKLHLLDYLSRCELFSSVMETFVLKFSV